MRAQAQNPGVRLGATFDTVMKSTSLALLVLGVLAIPAAGPEARAAVRIFADKNAFAHALGGRAPVTGYL